MARRRKKRFASPFYVFMLIWLLSSGVLPIFTVAGFLLILGFSVLAAVITAGVASKAAEEKQKREEPVRRPASVRKTDASPSVRKTDPVAEPAAPAPVAASPARKSYGPEVDPIVQEGNRALSEMGRLYTSIKDPEVRSKINEIMRITDKITQDAIADPSDIPQIKKFMNYYLPTTIKLLNAYDRMSSQGIEGENLTKSMNSINEMLDAAIEAYKKRLDSLFANQALDIETDIQVMNTMLAREGLSGGKDFQIAEPEEPKLQVAESN